MSRYQLESVGRLAIEEISFDGASVRGIELLNLCRDAASGFAEHVRHIQILHAVSIVIAPSDSHAEAELGGPEFLGDIGESAIAVITD